MKKDWRINIARKIYSQNVKSYKRLISFDKTRANKIYNLNKIFGKLAYGNRDHYLFTLKEFHKFIRDNSNYPIAYIGVGLNYGLIKNFYKERVSYQTALTIDPIISNQFPWLFNVKNKTF